jgi:chemotaxis protein MotB
MKKKKAHHEEPENAERWLLTYADLITLLLGLFVILYAMSKVDAAKYAEVAAALGGVFGKSEAGKIAVTQSGTGILPIPIPNSVKEREEVAKSLASSLERDIKSGYITLSANERGVTVHVSESLGFASGSAEPKREMYTVLDTLVAILSRLPHDLRVEGHTDDIPINTPAFRSNWHLSVARAVNVAYYLIETHGLNPEKVSVAGYGEFHPLVPNTSVANRAKNRRVDIVILSGAEQPKSGLLDTTAKFRGFDTTH